MTPNEKTGKKYPLKAKPKCIQVRYLDKKKIKMKPTEQQSVLIIKTTMMLIATNMREIMKAKFLFL